MIGTDSNEYRLLTGRGWREAAAKLPCGSELSSVKSWDRGKRLGFWKLLTPKIIFQNVYGSLFM
jgi:hypothetical protein